MALERSVVIKVETSGAKRSLDSLDRSFDKTQKSASSLTSTVVKLASVVGASTLLSSSISQITSFEQAIAGVASVSGATSDQLKTLTDQARELGATTVFGAEQAAEAQKFLAQAGLDVNEVLSATPGLLQLAQAGQIGLAESADIATNVLSGLRLEVDQLNRVNDVLAKTAASSNTNIQQLGQALSFAAPLAASAKISIEESAAAIGILSDNGIQASRAGTGLIGVIRQLSKVTSEGAVVLEKYGIDQDKVDVSSVGLSSALSVLQGANLSVADSFALFGTEAGAAAQALISSTDKVDSLTSELENASGAAKNASDILSDTLGSSIKGLVSALSEATLQAGDSGLSGALREIITVSTGVIQSYNGLLDVYSESSNLTDAQLSSIDALSTGLIALATIYSGRLAGSIAVSTAATAKSIEVRIAESAAYRENAIVVARADAQKAASARLISEVNLTRAKTEQRVAATELSRAKAVEASLVQERLAEQSRLKAQISSTGRMQSLTRLAEIEISRVNILKQVAAAEASSAAATNSLTSAYASNSAASKTASASVIALNSSLAANKAASVSASVAARGLSAALALVGGPVGAATIAIAALAIYATSTGESKRTTDELTASVDDLGRSLDQVSKKQAAVRLLDLSDEIEELQRAKSAADGLVETYNVRASGGFDVSTDNITRALGEQEVATSNLNKALETQESLQSIVNGTYVKTTKNINDNNNGVSSLINSYDIYNAKLDRSVAINQKYDKLIKEINEDVKDQAQASELVAKAEANRAKELEALTRKQVESAGKLSENQKVLLSLTESLTVAEEEDARAKTILAAQSRLSASATDEQSRAVAELAGQLFDLNEAQKQEAEEQKRLDTLLSSVTGKTDEYKQSIADLAVLLNDGKISQEQYNESVAEFSTKIDDAGNRQKSFSEIARASFESYKESVGTSNDAIAEVGENTFNKLGDSLATFITTGKIGIKEFAASVISDLARVAAQQAIVSTFSGSTIGGFFGFAQGGAFGGDTRYFANGGVPDLSSFSNSVVNKPTQFAAGGTPNNFMGEAGAEAILPLTRTSSGNLGVEAQLSGGGQAVFAPNITVQVESKGVQTGQQQGAEIAAQLNKDMKQLFAQFTQQARRPGGQLNPTGF